MTKSRDEGGSERNSGCARKHNSLVFFSAVNAISQCNSLPQVKGAVEVVSVETYMGWWWMD